MNAHTATLVQQKFAPQRIPRGLEGAYEAIWRAGIAQARADHFERKAVVDSFKNSPALFFHAIRPSLCTQEAIEDARRVIFGFKNLPTWRQESQLPKLQRAQHSLVYARYMRMYGSRLWARRAA